MKTKWINLSSLAVIVMAMSFFMVSCEKDDLSMGKGSAKNEIVYFDREGSSPDSDLEVTPYIIPGQNHGGNRTCEEVEAAFGLGEDYFYSTSGKFDYEYDEDLGKWVWIDDDGMIYVDFPGITVTVTDGTYVEFELDNPGLCVGAVIVKGSNDANVYFYDNGVKSDEGLAAPINASGNPAGLSNLTFCFVECEDNGGDCQTETAWGGDTAGDGAAWWFYYDASVGGEQIIRAGQHIDVGTVEVVDGTVYLVLTGGWELQDGEETVKIQGYAADDLPSSRPAAGNFDEDNGGYKGTSLTVEIGDYAFYAIHLDVQLCE